MFANLISDKEQGVEYIKNSENSTGFPKKTRKATKQFHDALELPTCKIITFNQIRFASTLSFGFI